MVKDERYKLYQGDCLEVMDGLISLGVKRKDFDILAANALNDACGLTNPRKATHEDIVEIFDNAF